MTLSKRFAAWITRRVGTISCAVFFLMLCVFSLPAAVSTGDPLVITNWVTQNALPLTLMPLIMVGQRVQGWRSERRDQETHDTVMEELALAKEERAILAEDLALLREVHAAVVAPPIRERS